MRSEYQPGLDGLRAIAVALVLVFHSDLGWLPGGFLGVSVFFTLSGFLITSLLIGEMETTGGIDLRGFWERRVRRLVPAALITIIGVSIASVWLSTPVEQSRLRGDAVAAVLYVSNWRSIVADLSYEEIFSSESPLIHLWSLAIEEQMYVLIPLLVVAVTLFAHARRVLALVAVALAAASTLISVFLVEGDRLYYGTDARAAEVLIGVVAAALIGPRVMSGGLRLPYALRWIPVVALAAVVMLSRFSSTNSTWVYAGLLPAFALLSLICVIGAITRGPLRTVLSARPLVAVGTLSYGLYVFHWPIFTWVDEERLGFGGVALFAVRLAATAVATGVSYVLIEQPIRARRILPSRRSLVMGVGAMSLIAVIVPVSVLDSVSGQPATEVRVLSTVPSTIPTTGPTTVASSSRILVLGDSTAENVARALAEIKTLGVISGGVLGCPLVTTREVFDRPRASQETSYCPDNVDIVRTHAPEIDLVLIVGGVANQWAYTSSTGVRVEPGSENYRRDFDALMEEILTVVSPWAVPVIVLDNPVTRPDDGVLGDEPEAHAAWRMQIERWDEEWETVERITIDDALAPPDSLEGRAQRPDGVHLEETFAAELARTRIAPDILSLFGHWMTRLTDIGCLMTRGTETVFDLEVCRTS